MKKNKIKSTILIVDDESGYLDLLSRLLTSNGYNIRAAKTGHEAIGYAGVEPPDLILLDIRLPDMNGLEVCKTLKAAEKTKSVPVIFLSALNDTSDKLAGFKAGGIDYISKPFISEEVIVRIQNHLEISQLRYGLEQKTFELQLKNKQLNNEINERKLAEESTKKSEDYFRVIFENNSSAISIIEPDTTISMVNDAYCQISGYTRDEVVGMSWTRQIPPDDLERLKEYNRKRLLDPQSAPGKYEFKFYHKSGQIKYGLMSLSMTLDRKKIIASFLDITEQKIAESDLRNSYSLLEATLDSFHNGILVISDTGTVIKTNAKFAELWKIPTKIISTADDKTLLDFIIDQLADPDEFLNKIKELYNNPVAESFDTVLFKDGRIFERISKPVLLDGPPKARVWSFLDITDRKTAEQALRESEDKFKYVFDNSVIGKSITLTTGEIHVNRAFCDMLGYNSEQLEKTKWQDISHPDDLQMTQEAINTLISGKKDSARFIKRYFHKNCSVIWTDVATSLRRDANGNPLYFITAVMDITDRKKSEQEILKLNETLEQRVADRTAELVAINHELESFSYSVSHDLRAPLRHISGYADFLKNEYPKALPEKGQYYLDTISTSARQMGILIDDLLQYSKSGRIELHKTLFNTDRVLDEVVSHYKTLSSSRKIEWKIEPLPDIHGDIILIHTLWINLIDNAVKYTRLQNKAVIEIGSKTGNGEHIFFIKDNGIGFDMQYAGKLFGVFQRLHSSAQFEGTGIGLANVQRIIMRHNGKVWAEAEPDKGATFYFSIPVKSDKKKQTKR